MPSFLGMRGTGNWVNNQRPENWRQMMLYLYPNGSAPLTAIMSMLGEEPTDDPHFHWWSKTLPKQASTLIDGGVYDDSGLTTAYTSGGSAGDTLYLKMTEEEAKQHVAGHKVLIRDADNHNVDTVAKVTDRTEAGGSSYLTIKLLEDADASNDLDSADTLLIIGSMKEEGFSGLPESVAYDPQEFSNYTQISPQALKLTRTAMKTRLRTGDAYQEAKRECLELLSIQMEKDLIWSVKSLNTVNGQPERTMDGILSFLRQYAPQNINDFTLDDPDFDDTTWVNGGEDWLDIQLEKIFRHGNPQGKLALVGSGALLGLKKLAQTGGEVQLEAGQTDYGLQVINYLTPFGTLPMKTHPLFSFEPTNRNSMLIVEPRNLKYRFIDDVFFVSDDNKNNNSHPYFDGKEEGYVAEWSLEMHFPETFGFLNGIGLDNPA